MPELKLPGRYKATVTEARVAEARTGTPYLGLTLRTDEREFCDAFLYLSEKAFDRSVMTLVEVFGFDGDFDTVERQLVGKRCSITAEEEEDDRGDTRVRVKWINPEQAPPADRAFLARLSERARTLRARAGVKAPPPAAPAVTGAAEDAIPF